MISDQQLILVALSLTPEFGTKRVSQLLEALAAVEVSLENFWNNSEKYLQELQMSEHLKKVLLEHHSQIKLSKLKKELDDRGVTIVTIFDDVYPSLLKEIPDRPQVLYTLGKLKSEWSLPIAVVGTRRITSYGKTATKLITKGLVASGAEIISGFMYGVDAMAHQTAIDEGGYTVGVLGYGFDHSFPNTQAHLKLRKQLLEQGGALISEYFPDTQPIKGFFPQRNRIIAGMSRGVVVTEATSKSGSKITATYAADYGRDVFAVPGMITSPFSEGVKDLINNGAKLVTSSNDIIEEYRQEVAQRVNDQQTPVIQGTQQRILTCLSSQPLDANDLSVELEVSPSELFTSLSLLEIQGQIRQEMGKYLLII